MRSLIIAFSTYSKIPMPHIKWDEKSMKYSMCWFPMVGAVIGLCSMGCYFILMRTGVGSLLSAVLLAVLPLLLTGGIHMDGYLDTVDAKSSYQSKEQRLRILKDPHAGAFAMIYGMIYVLLYIALFSEIEKGQILFVAMGYIYSRILSGLAVVTFRKAKSDGMLATTSDAAAGNVKWILLTELILWIAGIMVFGRYYSGGLVYSLACVAAGLLSFIYYRYMSYKWFGGTTGDLAGYFLQVCELMILLSVVVAKILLQLL